MKASQFVLHIAAIESFDMLGRHYPKELLSWFHWAQLSVPSLYQDALIYRDGIHILHTIPVVVVRWCPPLCKSSRQSDSWWRCLSTEVAWRCAWCTVCSRSGSCCTGRAACSGVVVEGRVNEEDDVLEVKGKVRQPTRVRHVQHQVTDPFQAHKDDTAIRVTWAKRVAW